MRWRQYYEDRLVRRFYDADRSRGFVSHHGKRVPKACKLNREEVREYVEKGSIYAIKLIMVNRKIGLAAAKALLDEARGTVNRREFDTRR